MSVQTLRPTLVAVTLTVLMSQDNTSVSARLGSLEMAKNVHKLVRHTLALLHLDNNLKDIHNIMNMETYVFRESNTGKQPTKSIHVAALQ